MTSPNETVMALAQIARQLDGAVRELRDLDESAVRARSRFEVGFAHAFLSAEGAMDVRKQQAVLSTSDAKLDAEILDARVRAQRSLIRALETRIDVGRSLNAALRAEIGISGMTP